MVNNFYKNILLLACILASSVFATAQQYRFEHLYPAKGLARNVRMLIQDDRGFLWFATESGLFRYDGYDFKLYDHNPDDKESLSDGTIHTLFQDKAGYIWVGTQNRGLNRLDPITDKIVRYTSDYNDSSALWGDYVWCIYEDSELDLWVATQGGGLQKLLRETDEFVHYRHDANNPNSISTDTVYSIFEDSKQRLWIGTQNGLTLFDRTTQNCKVYNPSNSGLGGSMVFPIAEEKQDVLWIGTLDNGLYRFEVQSETFTAYLPDQATQPSLSNGSINDLLIHDNKIWILTDAGLNILDLVSNRIEVYEHDPMMPASLSQNTPWAIIKDNADIIWIATVGGGGINKLLPKKAFTHLYHNPTDEKTLSGDIVRNIYKDSKGMIWIGVTGKGVDQYNPTTGEFTHYAYDVSGNDPTKLNFNQATCFYEPDPEHLWIGTLGGGVNVFNRKTGKFTYIEHRQGNPNSLGDNRIQFIYSDKEGTIWVGSDAPTLSKYIPETNSFITYRHIPHDTTTFNWGGFQTQAVYEDAQQNLWLGTWGGLNYFSPKTGKVKRYNHNPDNPYSLPDDKVLAIYGTDTVLWIGTYTGGLVKMNLKTGAFSNFTEKKGLPSSTVYAILPDNQGYLWLSTNNGLSKFSPSSESFENYSAQDGLQDEEFFWGSAHKTQDGQLFFGGVNGITAFYPEQITEKEHKPSVYLTDFRLFYHLVTPDSPNSPLDKPISITSKLDLSHEQYVVTFGFVALDYTSPLKNKYAYKMEGFDAEWITTDRREVTYMNLKPGHYTFKVIAANSNGTWNEEGVNLQITIHPPFWQTWWFISAAAFLLVFSTFMFYRLRLRQIKRQKRKLEKKVQERTIELKQANQEILAKNTELEQQKEEIQTQRDNIEDQNIELHKQRDEIVNKNTAITDSIQYAGRIQRAVLPNENLIKQSLKEYFVYLRPKDIISGDFYWMKTEDHKTYIAVADCTGHGVPGAFMSLLGITQLNEVLSRKKERTAGEILDELRTRIIASLHQTGGEAEPQDGMDLAFVIIDSQNSTANFAGAYNHLIIIRQGEILEYKADRMPIGIHFRKTSEFTNHHIDLQKGDCLYMFSDGYADQLSEQNHRKFLNRNFKELLANIAEEPMAKQKEIIDDTIKRWQGNNSQVDDILVFGLRI